MALPPLSLLDLGRSFKIGDEAATRRANMTAADLAAQGDLPGAAAAALRGSSPYGMSLLSLDAANKRAAEAKAFQEKEFAANKAYRNASLGLQREGLGKGVVVDKRVVDPRTGRVIYEAPAAGAGAGMDNQTFDNISGVRKEVQNLPSYKNYAQAMPIYKSMVETAGRNSKASDLNLVYGLGKIFDPTSVVREGEMIMAKNTASLPDWLVGAINTVNGGAFLQPETRKAIIREAQGRIQGYKGQFDQDAKQYRGIADRYNFNPADIIPDFGPLPVPTSTGSMPGPEFGQSFGGGGVAPARAAPAAPAVLPSGTYNWTPDGGFAPVR